MNRDKCHFSYPWNDDDNVDDDKIAIIIILPHMAVMRTKIKIVYGGILI